MQRALVSTMLVLGVISGSCATMPQDQQLTGEELALACELGRTVSARDLSQGEELPPAERQRLAELRERIVVRTLPYTARCPDGRRRFRPPEYGDFFDGIGLSTDRMHAVITGGFIYAPQLGGGGECYFERGETGWRRLACISTWAV